jgi:hypothetical protein
MAWIELWKHFHNRAAGWKRLMGQFNQSLHGRLPMLPADVSRRGGLPNGVDVLR